MRNLIFLCSIIFSLYLLSGCAQTTDADIIKEDNFPEIEIGQTDFNYNIYHQEDGLFEFEYKNNYEVRNINDIYFLEELSSGNVSFQIFKNTKEISFDKSSFKCEENEDIEICYSNNTPGFILKNLKLFPGPKDSKYQFLRRAQALEIILTMKFPEEDFSKYQDDCFIDVYKNDIRSGYICFAKEKNYVVGIAEHFHPDSGVNLWGTLKLLFLIFETDNLNSQAHLLDKKVFDKMTIYHHAYELIAKSYYEGIIKNERHVDFWPNRIIYKSEFDNIVDNFFSWSNGKPLKDYISNDGISLASNILIKDFFIDLSYEEDDIDDFDTDDLSNVLLKENLNDLEIYVQENPYVYQYIYTLSDTEKDDIREILIDYDKERIKVGIYIKYTNNKESHLKLDISKKDFSVLKSDEKSYIIDPNLSPNLTKAYESANVDSYNIYLSDEDFNKLLEDRTLQTRYPAFLEIHYRNGYIDSHSIVIKTRGNANRGYIKSSFTIESFDEFFNGDDEIKLRSMISDKTLIKEKIIYNAFKNLGYITPEFSEAMLTINNIPFGFYQVTEAVKDDFFKKRGFDVDNYYYARNISSPYLANLSDLEDVDIFMKHYTAKGKKDIYKLINLIKDIENNDKSLIGKINIQNVFDFTLFSYILSLNDSYTHNYYLFFDKNTELWNLFFWDLDTGIESISKASKSSFKNFVSINESWYNALIYYVFSNISEEDFKLMLDDFKSRWEENVNLINDIDYYLKNYKDAFEYDNKLWNYKYLERKDNWFDTITEINELRDTLVKINKGVGNL